MDEDAAYAVEILEKLRRVALQRQNKSAAVKLAQLIAILESPLYNRIVTVQKSLEKLSDIQASCIIEKDDFGLDPHTGQLWLTESAHMRWADSENAKDDTDEDEEEVVQERSHDRLQRTSSALISAKAYTAEEYQQEVERMAQGRKIVTARMKKRQNEALGFSIVGLVNNNRDQLGIYIDNVDAGSVADVEGGLHNGDQLLAINRTLLDREITHEEAVQLLQTAPDASVELVVARDSGVRPTLVHQASSTFEENQASPAKNLTRATSEEAMLLGSVQLCNCWRFANCRPTVVKTMRFFHFDSSF